MSKSMNMSMQEQESSCLLGVVDPSLRLFGKMIAPAAGPINKADHVPLHLQDEGSEAQTAASPDEAVMAGTKTPGALKPPRQGVPCPRCNSEETKFCYFNNYNVNQPRHFCKGCHRYWTAGGNLRNVPVGAGRRKNKSTQHDKLSSSAPETGTVRIDSFDAAQPPLPCSGIAHPEPLHDPPPSSLKACLQEVVPSSLLAHLGASHGAAPSGITHGAPFHAGEDTLPLSAITHAVPFHAKQDPSPMGTANPVQFYAKQNDMLPPGSIAHSTPFHARQEETHPTSGITHGVPFHAGQDPPSPSVGIANSDAKSEGHNPALDMPSANPQAQLCLRNLEWGSANGCYFPLPVPFGGVSWPFMPNFGFPGTPSMLPPPPLWNPYGWAAPWPMPYPATMPYPVPPHTVKRPCPSPLAPEESADVSICAPKSLRFSDPEATTGSSILSTLGLSIKVEATSSAGFFNGFQPKGEVFQPKPTSKVPNPVAFSNSLAFQESQ